MEGGKRKRIQMKKAGLPAIVDELEWLKNQSSNKARVITTVAETIGIKLWYDKHYWDRQQLGDESGKREGIDTGIVQQLVLQSIKHLLFYAANVKNFKFLNHTSGEVFEHATRVVCQQQSSKGMLNVVIEAHYIALDNYEITVKTAMCEDGFRMSDGQYALEILSDTNSTLRFMSKGKLNEVLSV